MPDRSGPNPQPPSPTRVAVGAAIGLTVALVVALVAWFVTRDDDAKATPAPPPQSADEVLDDIIAFVESERGLDFKERPVVTLLDDAEFIERYTETIAEDQLDDADQLANYTGIYQALGWLPAGVSLQEAGNAFGEAGVGGVYDPATDELIVRGFEMSPLTRAIVAHELVHALDDQWFDLDRPEYDDAVDEVGSGFSALVEGNASRIEDAYRAELSDDDAREAAREEASLGGDIDFGLLTIEYLQLQLSAYVDGPVLVDAVLDDGGQAALDAALADPPDTSEQVLHPERYIEREERVEVDPPPADGEIIEEGVFGEYPLRVLMLAELGERGAADSAESWAGDWFVAWRDGNSVCVRVDVLMDDESEADDLAAGLARFGAERPTSVSVRFTACS